MWGSCATTRPPSLVKNTTRWTPSLGGPSLWAPLAQRSGAPPSEPARPLEGGALGLRRLLDDGSLGRRRPTTEGWVRGDGDDEHALKNSVELQCPCKPSSFAYAYKRTRLVKNKLTGFVFGACVAGATPMLASDSSPRRRGDRHPAPPSQH